jgi:hypothetical protein
MTFSFFDTVSRNLPRESTYVSLPQNRINDHLWRERMIQVHKIRNQLFAALLVYPMSVPDDNSVESFVEVDEVLSVLVFELGADVSGG